MIRFLQVSKAYRGGRPALQSINFHLAQGDIAFLTGHSGAGKSTLLKLICGIERPSAGNVFFDGVDISRLPSSEIPFLRRQIGMIFQNHQLLMDKTVFDNVALPLIIAGVNESDIKKRVNAALDKVGLYDKGKYYPLALSGGEQQRVGIARAVVHKPKVLLADEPTGNLDDETAKKVMEVFETFNHVGVTVLIVTHNHQLISKPHHKSFRIESGRLVK
ncbi:cell division ATP-binding protein FtsE [Thorsellia kenyensis]|uniref:Cell division ATP-binding protein FtsE n=1 Tax=Thorsellia kenyensis TaxID=1549888 RepID=A0ABV6C6P9_9GAMM